MVQECREGKWLDSSMRPEDAGFNKSAIRLETGKKFMNKTNSDEGNNDDTYRFNGANIFSVN